ncbi:MAG: hypothetical protein K0S74_1411 [Chlamydiales bacterium]|jgi:Skp family chaperone for outer membrane proteins|nr:hypothetical protein [Chlamydiales bacterium]
MKRSILVAALMLLLPLSLFAANNDVGVFNVEELQANVTVLKEQLAEVENLDNQFRVALDKKQIEIEEIDTKLNDPDYRDGLSPSAEAELTKKREDLQQEMMQYYLRASEMSEQQRSGISNRFRQILRTACKEIAQEKRLKYILSSESCYYYEPGIDVTKPLIDKISQKYNEEKLNQAAIEAESDLSTGE